jgi:hypothetical protein
VAFRALAQQSLSDEEKRRLFLKAREEMTTIPYTPPPSTAPTPRPKPRPTVGTEFTPTPQPTPIPARPTPLPVTQPKPVPTATPPATQANIVVRETAVAAPDEESEPPPKPQSFLSRLFGGGSYKYLTSSVRRAIDRAPVTRGRWRYIVVHNSGTKQGSASAFEHYHRNVRRMPNGLAYHFVIGNGTSTKEGAIEIGNRWHRQIQGGHVHSDYLNNIAIGVCLVGDFNRGSPRKGQLDSLEELIDYLRGRVGKIQRQSAVVRAHKDINPPQWPTDCPGNDFPYRWLRKF